MLSRLTLLVFLVSRGVQASIGAVGDLYVVSKQIAPDGFPRPAVLAGSSQNDASFPGPLITAIKGTHFRLNVKNTLNAWTDHNLLRSTSIHWHGLSQTSSWSDGPVGITQCPISPGDSFVYDFPTRNQAGTFWYHSHYSTQYCDGLRGPIVVYDPLDFLRYSYDVDDESTIITLADWYHTPARSAGQHGPNPSSTLINGKGRYVGGPASPLAEMKVQPGLRYRFRLVAMSCSPNWVFSIDSHQLTVIEADGITVQPVTVDSIQIFAGQRYSFILHANQAVNNYWIRAKPNLGYQGFDNGLNSGILRYSDAAVQDPTTSLGPVQNLLKETDLHPLERPAAPGLPVSGGADVAINLALGYGPNGFTVNGATFKAPDVPVLLQILNGRPPKELLPAGSVYSLPPNKVIEVTIPGFGGVPHPFHLHGQPFSVVRSAGSSAYNYINPIKRDVVSIGDNSDNVTIRFTTGNTGPWLFHCHVEWHYEAGLAVVFAEDVQGTPKNKPPSAWEQLCPKYAKLAPEL